jgi:hypothetical protein
VSAAVAHRTLRAGLTPHRRATAEDRVRTGDPASRRAEESAADFLLADLANLGRVDRLRAASEVERP